MLHLETKHLEVVKQILAKYAANQEVWAFGSRVQNKAKPFSDIDLVIVSPIAPDSDLIDSVKNAFSDSDLPYFVDVTEWQRLPGSFQQHIRSWHAVIQSGKAPTTPPHSPDFAPSL